MVMNLCKFLFFLVCFLLRDANGDWITIPWTSSQEIVSFTNVAVIQMGSSYGWTQYLKCVSPSIPLSCSPAARFFTDQLVYPNLTFDTGLVSAWPTYPWFLLELTFDISVSTSSVYLSRLGASYSCNAYNLTIARATAVSLWNSALSSPIVVTTSIPVTATVAMNLSFTNTSLSMSSSSTLQFTVQPLLQFLNYGNFAGTLSIHCTNATLKVDLSLPPSPTTDSPPTFTVASTTTTFPTTTTSTSTTTTTATSATTTTTFTTTSDFTTSSPTNSTDVSSVATSEKPSTVPPESLTPSTSAYQISSTHSTVSIDNGSSSKQPTRSETLLSSSSLPVSLGSIILSTLGALGILVVCMIVTMYPVWKLRKKRQLEEQRRRQNMHRSGYAYPIDELSQTSVMEIQEPLMIADSITILGQVDNGETFRFYGMTGNRSSVILYTLSEKQLEKMHQQHLSELIRLPHQENVLEIKGLYSEKATYLVYENIVSSPFKRWWYQPRNFNDTPTILRLYYAICMATAIDFLHDNHISLYCYTFSNVLYSVGQQSTPVTLKLCPLIYADLDIGTVAEDFTYAQQCGPPEIMTATTSSQACDMWYLGLLIWHFFEIGIHPFGELLDIHDIRSLIQDQHRIPVRPKFMSESIWNVVKECWKYDPSQRPTSAQLVKRLSEIYEKLSNVDSSDFQEKEEEKEKTEVAATSFTDNNPDRHQYVSFTFTPGHEYCNFPPAIEKK